MGLFRKKKAKRPPTVAIEYQPDAVEIEQRPVPGVAYWSLYLLIILVVVGVTWASLAEVDRIVTGRGKLITTSPTIVVQSLDTSLINALKVRTGQVVKKGEVLAVLDPTFTQADVSNLKARLISLTAQIGRLRAELTGREYRPGPGANADERLQKMLFATRRDNYRATLRSYQKKRDSLSASLATNLADQKVLAKRVNALKQIESMHRRLLQRGSGARAKVLEAENLRLQVQRDLELAVNKQREIRFQLDQVKAEILAFKKGWRQKATEELVKATRDRESVVQQLVKAQKRRERVVLRSPAHAMVLEVAKRSVGSVVREGETLVTLVPLDVPIEAEVKIDARDVGFIRRGDQVRIKFDAFPFQRHGTVEGRVRVISGDVFRRGQGGERAAPDEPEVYYLVLVTLPKVKLRAVPADFRLIPGMTLTAEIKVGTRSVISYLVYPLIKAFDESIREP